MFGVLLVLFVVVPAAELYVILQVSHAIGVFETIAALLVVSVLGAWLCRIQGFGVVRRLQTALDQGRLPTRELEDGALILLAGALLLTPGFLGDIVGILLLLPPTRAVARAGLNRLVRDRIGVTMAGSRRGPVVDATVKGTTDPRDDGPPAIPLGP